MQTKHLKIGKLNDFPSLSAHISSFCANSAISWAVAQPHACMTVTIRSSATKQHLTDTLYLGPIYKKLFLMSFLKYLWNTLTLKGLKPGK